MAQWRSVPAGGLAFAFLWAAGIAWCAFFGNGWVPFVDDANFAVHEAGHPVFGAVSTRLGVYGGTLAQLAFPVMCMVEFARRRWTTSYALCGVWFGESVLNVARYVADARAMELPLKGFSDTPLHDWNVILARWGLLNHDILLANALRVFGWLAIACALAFIALRWREDVRVAHESG